MEATQSMESLKAQNPDCVIDTAIAQGGISDTICRIAYQDDFDLIVMGTKGVSGLKKVLMGSVASSVVKDAKVPVLVVPPKADLDKTEHVCLSLDLSNAEEELVHQSILLTAQFSSSFHLLSIGENMNLKELQSSLLEKLSRQFSTYHFDAHVLKKDDPAGGLKAYLHDFPHCLLVMYARKKSFFESVFDKSQTVEMACHTTAPLLVMR
jgi:hypothetical protein